MNSTKALARHAGLLYLLGCLHAPITLIYLPGILLVPGNALATADRVRASEGLIRAGLAAELLSPILIIFAVLALYQLFRKVHENTAIAMAVLMLVSVPISFLNALNHIGPLILINSPAIAAVLNLDQVAAFVMLFLQLHHYGIVVAQIFWGLWLFPYGILIMQSGFIPRALAFPLFVAGAGYLVNSFGTLLLPPSLRWIAQYAIFLGVGELPILVWLLIWGARSASPTRLGPKRETVAGRGGHGRQEVRSLVILSFLALALLTNFASASFAQTSLVDQGRVATMRGERDSAIALLERAVAESPKDAEAHYQLAIAHGRKAQASGVLGKVRHGPRAKRELEAAIVLDPGHIEARMMLVYANVAAPGFMGGSVEKALEHAKEIKAIDPVAGHRAYSIVYTHQKRFNLAKQELLHAIRDHPYSPQARNYFGQYLASVEKNYAVAFAEFEAALRIDPSYMPSHYYLGRTAALADSNLTSGVQSLRNYLAYTPKDNEPGLAWAHHYLGIIYENGGQETEAKNSYQAALALNPALKEASQGLRRIKERR